MRKLVATNIRLPKEELLFYRQLALESGKSFSLYIREILEIAVRTQILGSERKKITKKKMGWKEAPIWELTKYKKWASRVRDGAEEHDKYIYGDPHGKGKYER